MGSVLRNKYDYLFGTGLLLVVLAWCWLRPFNSPWHPFIAGDGLGYYSYLPAKFIHNDPDLDFKWFNRVYNANYVYSSFENPEDNLLVEYGGKKINKYYQGLSYVWFPFFAAGHLCAKVFHDTPDGFSRPYQLAMGLASLFYALLGLWFLRRLLHSVFKNQLLAAVVPFFIFFGTPLFTYAIFANTLSHSYSFTFLTGFLCFLHRFIHEPRQKTLNFLLAALFFVITICIRPLNGLILLVVPAFLPRGFRRSRPVFERLGFVHALLIVVTLGALAWQLWLTHIQTGSLVAYTYTGERFMFSQNRFPDSLWGYQMGLLWYVPLIFFSFFGVFFMRRGISILLLIVFLAVLFLYSSWWYWTIVKRAMIDFYALPAILLSAPLNRSRTRSKRIVYCSFLLLLSLFFQFKNVQISRGILSEFTTHRGLYWSNFFRLKNADVFPIPPESILDSESQSRDFEADDPVLNLSRELSAGGKGSLLLNGNVYISTPLRTPLPALFQRPGRKKLRLSLDLFPEAPLPAIHVFIQFMDSAGGKIEEVPFYINEDRIFAGEWDHKEFGYDIVDEAKLASPNVSWVQVTIWNVDPQSRLFVDNLRLEFVLCDTRFETIK